MIVIEGLNYFGVPVSDLERSVEFYRDYFDFEFLDRISDDSRAFLKMGEEVIALIPREGTTGASCRLSFTIDEEDYNDMLDDIEDNEFALDASPDEENGIIMLTDPDGNEIELSIKKI